MANSITFLQAVNASLKRARVIQGDIGDLTTSTVASTATGLVATGPFTRSNIQTEIDVMLQIWQEFIAEVYRHGYIAPQVASATLVLVTAQREYTMPSNFERFTKDASFRGATRQSTIYQYPGGYEQMLLDQPGLPSQWQGESQGFAISPVALQTIRLDREPTSNESGWTYNSLYETRIARTSTMATDTMPFADSITDAGVPVVAEGWNRVYKKEFDSGIFQTSVSRAMEFAGQKQKRTSWGPRPARYTNG